MNKENRIAGAIGLKYGHPLRTSPLKGEDSGRLTNGKKKEKMLMKNKILLQATLSSAMILCAGSVQAVVSCSFDDTTGTLTISGDGTLTSQNITNAVSNKSLITNVVFDANSNITEIGTSAFESATGLTSIEIPNTVTTIGQGAFWGNTALTSIDIPSSVTSIGDVAFYSATSLESVNFGDNSKLETIGQVAFYFTGLTDFSIPDSVTKIGAGAFAGTNISTLILPESLFSDGVVGISPYAAISDNTTHLYCKEGNQKCREYQAVACNTVTLTRLSCSHSGDPYRTDLTFGTYQKESDGRYVLDGVRYKSFADIQNGKNGIALKRIYTIDEANAVAGKTNTVSIRYR